MFLCVNFEIFHCSNALSLHWPGIINTHFPAWITDYKDFLRTMIFFRYPIIWCFRCRESQLSRKIRLTADMQVIKLFWLKQRVRNHPGKLIIKITTMLILAFSYFLYSEERDGGYMVFFQSAISGLFGDILDQFSSCFGLNSLFSAIFGIL